MGLSSSQTHLSGVQQWVDWEGVSVCFATGDLTCAHVHSCWLPGWGKKKWMSSLAGSQCICLLSFTPPQSRWNLAIFKSDVCVCSHGEMLFLVKRKKKKGERFLNHLHSISRYFSLHWHHVPPPPDLLSSLWRSRTCKTKPSGHYWTVWVSWPGKKNPTVWCMQCKDCLAGSFWCFAQFSVLSPAMASLGHLTGECTKPSGRCCCKYCSLKIGCAHTKQSLQAKSMPVGVTQRAPTKQAVINVILRFTLHRKWCMASR